MSSRPYRLGQRQAATEQTRMHILSATRELLMSPDGHSRFSIEAVTRRADVARMTVYHQFGSKGGLLEALCDLLVASGGMEQLAMAFLLLEEDVSCISLNWESRGPSFAVGVSSQAFQLGIHLMLLLT